MTLVVGIFLDRGVAQARDCAVERYLDLPIVANETGSPVVSILIDGQPRDVLLDTGGSWSLLDPAVASQFRSRDTEVAGRLGLNAIPLRTAVRVPSIQVGGFKVANVDFVVAPEDYMHYAGTLGANWLYAFDVEIDPVGNKVSLLSNNHCGRNVIHWPHNDHAELPITVDRERLMSIPIALNGKTIRALIDTGSPETFLSLRAASELFGLTPDSPDMEAEGTVTDQTGTHHWYRHRFKSLSVGDITFLNPMLTIAPTAANLPDVVLGMHELRGLHLYFAYKEGKLYATTASGDIAARRAQPAKDGGAAPAGPDPLTRTNALDLMRTAFTALGKKDFAQAKIATDEALALNPALAEGYLVRAEIETDESQSDSALRDLTETLRLDPQNLFALLLRVRLDAKAGDAGDVLEDKKRALEAANGALEREPRNYAVRLLRAELYETLDDVEHAFADSDQAVTLRPKSAEALNSRCWTGAILGRLNAALADCNAAIEADPKSAEIWDSRAFVHFRANRLDQAQADYTAALALDPGLASSLYGRGLVKRRKGDPAAASIDIAAAEKADPQIAGHFGK